MEAMSSFRIERQYVTLVAPDARLLYGVEEERDPFALAQELERCRAEARQEALRIAGQEAERLLEEAQTQAQAILDKAREDSLQTALAAERAAEARKQEALQEGLRLARQEAEAEADARRGREAAELARMTDKLRADYALLVDALEGDALCLILDVVKKIIGVKLEETDEVFLGLVSTALEQLKQTGAVLIRVGPEDYHRYFGDRQSPGAAHFGKAEALVVEEEEFRHGDLVVESEGEVLDFSIDKQLRRLQDAFLQKESAAAV